MILIHLLGQLLDTSDLSSKLGAWRSSESVLPGLLTSHTGKDAAIRPWTAVIRMSLWGLVNIKHFWVFYLGGGCCWKLFADRLKVESSKHGIDTRVPPCLLTFRPDFTAEILEISINFLSFTHRETEFYYLCCAPDWTPENDASKWLATMNYFWTTKLG